jgi:GTP-binding protein Era
MKSQDTPFRSGIVVLAGRPNVGKSSLINRLVEYKASIVSDKPQTTRNVIRCVYNGDGFQIVFTDTPGIHLPKHALGRTIVDAAVASMNDANLVCYVVEAGDRSIGDEDEEILACLEKAATPILLVVNKCDTVKDRDLPERVASIYRSRLSPAGAVAVSAKSGKGLPEMVSFIVKYLPEGPPFYDEDIFVDRPEKFIASEIIREKVLRLTHEEVPHSAAVEIEEYKSPDEYPDREVLFIRATLYVEREGQKRIVIGDKGSRLKEIGRLSRLEIQSLTGHRVYLDLWVKVRSDWRRSESDLRKLGIKEQSP